ncbi:MAG TPA: cupin domain-containing protein [Mycobacteriales bacterium]|nr:cupin domain-containing protein [Mycobacteriales bacterium]
MPSTNKDIAETSDWGVAVERTDHLDDITVNFVSIRETHSLRDALASLPNGQCQCPHWGYVLSGRLILDYGDREEIYGPGDAFYMTPGHVPTAEAGTELVQFSPKDRLRETLEAIQAAMGAHAG